MDDDDSDDTAETDGPHLDRSSQALPLSPLAVDDRKQKKKHKKREESLGEMLSSFGINDSFVGEHEDDEVIDDDVITEEDGGGRDLASALYMFG